jgi:hypothetical protein
MNLVGMNFFVSLELLADFSLSSSLIRASDFGRSEVAYNLFHGVVVLGDTSREALEFVKEFLHGLYRI